MGGVQLLLGTFCIILFDAFTSADGAFSGVPDQLQDVFSGVFNLEQTLMHLGLDVLQVQQVLMDLQLAGVCS